MTDAQTAGRLASREGYGAARDVEVWQVEKLVGKVAAVLMPPGHQSVRCGSKTCQLPPDERSGVRSAGE